MSTIVTSICDQSQCVHNQRQAVDIMLLRSSTTQANVTFRRAVPRVRAPRLTIRAQEQTSVETSTAKQAVDQVPIGCSRYTVQLRKPLGIVLEQDSKTGNIYVMDVKADSNAEKDGQVKKGDQLIATSGIIYSSETDYNGAMVKTGQKLIRMLVLGESFKTVSAAIGSHPGHMPVTLEFQKCDTSVSQ